MSADEINHLESTITLGMKINRDNSIWKKAFVDYNVDNHPKHPLYIGCAACYIKVLMHLKNKQ